MAVMEQIPIRVLNQDTAGVLARVERGETVEITSRGRPVARLSPVIDDPLADLVAAGHVLPPTIGAPFALPTAPSTTTEDGGKLLQQLRDEERW